MKGWDQQQFRRALERYKYALPVLALGVLLLLLPTGGGEEQPAQPTGEEVFDLAAFEKKVALALSAVEGAGDVRVVLALEEGTRQVLAQDREQDSGGYSASTVTLGRGSGTQEVVPVQTFAPRFRGALVVCPGGNDPAVRLELAGAVAALTGLGTDRISICAGEP